MRHTCDKHIGLIISGGRTGTKFLGRSLQSVYTDCSSFHEPGSVHVQTLKDDLLYNIPRFGIYKTVFGKLLRRTGIRNISDQYLAGKLNDEKAIHAIKNHRYHFYEGIPDQFIIESNYAFFGLIPVLPDAFPKLNIACIVRDPMTWILSYLKKDDRFGRRDVLGRVGLRITAPMVSGELSTAHWNRMTMVERLAWFYRFVYSRINASSKLDNNLKIWRYEDLFLAEDRLSHFRQLCCFLGAFEDRIFTPRLPDGILEKKINASPRNSRAASKSEILAAIDKWCAPTARAVGYDY